MHKIRVYVDTSVFGGTQENLFRDKSLKFFDRVHRGEFVILLSDATLVELELAPEPVRTILETLPDSAKEFVEINAEVEELTQKYLDARVLGPASHKDAQHVAAATVGGADLILSWNFRHIVNFNRIRGFNSVNIALGYRSMTIHSPMEVIEDE